jgi:hypothetical protein
MGLKLGKINVYDNKDIEFFKNSQLYKNLKKYLNNKFTIIITDFTYKIYY